MIHNWLSTMAIFLILCRQLNQSSDYPRTDDELLSGESFDRSCLHANSGDELDLLSVFQPGDLETLI